MWRIIDSVAGSEAAAPMPMMMRPMTSSLGLTEIAQTTDPPQKIATPSNISFLRPKLSPERAEHQHQAGEGQRVAADDPLQLRDVGVKLGLDAREDRAGDRVVEEGQEEDGEERGETEVRADAANDDFCAPAATRVERVRGSRCPRSCSPFLPVIPTSRPLKVVRGQSTPCCQTKCPVQCMVPHHLFVRPRSTSP